MYYMKYKDIENKVDLAWDPLPETDELYTNNWDKEVMNLQKLRSKIDNIIK